MKGELDILQILWESGPVVKLVLVSLIICSLVSWTIIFQKWKVFKEVQQNNAEFLDFFSQTMSLAQMREKADEFSFSSLGTMYQFGHMEFDKIREKFKSMDKEDEFAPYMAKHGVQLLERSLKHGANEAQEKLDGQLYTLASIGSISPFIGLFGTVWGIIDAFAGLASGGGSIEAVAPGIAEALVATAVGLAAAIPAVWAYNIFSSRVSSFGGQMESFGQEFLNLIDRSLLENQE